VHVYAYLRDIRDFHEQMRLEYNGPLRLLPEELHEFRVRFMREEALELLAAFDSAPIDRAGMLDALVDLSYVALGTAYLMGLQPALARDASKLPAMAAPMHVIGEDLNVAHFYEAGHRNGHVECAVGGLLGIHESCVGACTLFRWDHSEAWRRVHAANMQKRPAEADGSNSKRSSGFDVVKPPGWTAPNLSDLVL
jgi:predicted HAD superfamily Cof-like phosphohydrolase